MAVKPVCVIAVLHLLLLWCQMFSVYTRYYHILCIKNVLATFSFVVHVTVCCVVYILWVPVLQTSEVDFTFPCSTVLFDFQDYFFPLRTFRDYNYM